MLFENIIYYFNTFMLKNILGNAVAQFKPIVSIKQIFKAKTNY